MSEPYQYIYSSELSPREAKRCWEAIGLAERCGIPRQFAEAYMQTGHYDMTDSAAWNVIDAARCIMDEYRFNHSEQARVINWSRWREQRDQWRAKAKARRGD